MKPSVKISLPNQLFPFIWHFLSEYKLFVTIYVILAILAGFWGPLNSILVKQMIDYLPTIKDGDTTKLFLPAILLVVNFIVFDNFTWRGIAFIRAKYMAEIVNQIVGDLMEFMLHKSYQFYQDNLSGKISKQITNLADGIESLLFFIIANILRGTSLLLVAFITAYSVNATFFIILIIWLIFFVSFGLYMSNKLVALSDKLASSESIVVGELVDTLSNQGNVRIFAQHAFENLRLKPFLRNQQKNYGKLNYYLFYFNSVLGALIAIMMGFTVYFLIYFYGKNLITIGDFALILALAFETGHMTWHTINEVDEFNLMVGICRQSLQTLMPATEILDKPEAGILNCPQGRIYL